MADKRDLLIGIAAGLVAAIIWGGWPVVSQLSVGNAALTISDLIALRFLVAGLVLLPLVLRRGFGGLHPAKALFLSCGAGAPYALLAIGGLAFAPASHAGVVIPGTMLTTATIGGALLLGDRPTSGRLAGLAVIFSGVLMIGWDGLHPSGAVLAYGPTVWIGDLLFMGGGIAWASYTLGARAWKADPLHATALIAVISMLAYLPYYLVMGQSNLLTAPLGEVVFQGLYQGMGSGVLALIFYTLAVGKLGAARGAVFAALVPGATALLSIPVLGEVPGPLPLAGVVLVTLGMVAALGLVKLPTRRLRPAQL